MAARLFPEHPDYQDDSERLVVEALVEQLGPEDAVVHGVRITDPQYGDVELDALVLIAAHGAAVVEVKGGFVTYRDGQFHQSGHGEHVIEPTDQARRGIWSVKRFVEGRPDWSRGALRGAWLVAFPYTPVSGDMGPAAPRESIIGADDLDSAATIVTAQLDLPGHMTPLPAHGWVDATLQHLLGTWEDPAVIPARILARHRHVEAVTEAREFIVRATRRIPRMEFVGSAGTGKTWLAFEQAQLWAKQGERVCLVTYTRGVCEVLRHRFASVPRKHQPAFVGTFHQLAPQWGIDPSAGTGSDFWESHLPSLMREAAERLAENERFTAFVVDEAQDFADSWWPALLASGRGEAKLAVFRDDEQSVFSGRRGRPEVDLVPFELDENLRNTRQIVNSFRPLIDAQPVARGGDGPAVERITCPPGEAVNIADAAVEDLLDRRGWLPEHIALLTTKSRHSVQREMEGDKAAYWRDFWEYPGVFYSTVSGFKGLERPVIVLAVDGFHDGVDPRSVLYAGMSRARDLLVIVDPGGS